MDGQHTVAWYRSARWIQALDAREQEQVIHAIVYAADHANAGAPGHSQFLLIAKLSRMLDDRDHEKVQP